MISFLILDSCQYPSTSMPQDPMSPNPKSAVEMKPMPRCGKNNTTSPATSPNEDPQASWHRDSHQPLVSPGVGFLGPDLWRWSQTFGTWVLRSSYFIFHLAQRMWCHVTFLFQEDSTMKLPWGGVGCRMSKYFTQMYSTPYGKQKKPFFFIAQGQWTNESVASCRNPIESYIRIPSRRSWHFERKDSWSKWWLLGQNGDLPQIGGANKNHFKPTTSQLWAFQIAALQSRRHVASPLTITTKGREMKGEVLWHIQIQHQSLSRSLFVRSNL